MSYSQRGTDLAEYVTALNRRSNAECSSRPSKRMRLEELNSLHDSNLASDVNLPIIMPAPVDEPPSRKWTFRPSSRPRGKPLMNEVLLKPRTTCPDCYSRLCSTVCSFHKLFGDKGEATMITAGNELRANLEQHALVCVCALPCRVR